MPEYKPVPGFEVAEAADALSRALAFAIRAHAQPTNGALIPQVRKDTLIPYVSHLLQVAGLVLDHGGNLELAIAALLHDALEDGDGVTPAILHDRFGPTVARIVGDGTDTLDADTPETKAPWRQRKERYLRRA